MAIPAASGYPQYSGNLISPKFSMDLIEKFYCTSVFGDITVTDYTGDIKQCGDQITFFREPEIEIQDLEKDGKIEHQTLQSAPVTMTIDHRFSFSVKIDYIDEQQMCNWPKWKASFLKRASYNMTQKVDKFLLKTIYTEIDARNKGILTSAGYNFGASGAPLVVTSANVLQVLTELMAQLETLCASAEELFLVLPTQMKPILMSSPTLGAAYASGMSSSALLNGKVPDKIGGFNVYFSNNVYTVADGGSPAYFILGGRADSTAFALDKGREHRLIEDKDDPDKYYQGFMVWGSKVIRPEGLVGLYARLG